MFTFGQVHLGEVWNPLPHLRYGLNSTTAGGAPWGNGYRRRKCTRRHEFKSWTRLIAFHIALITLGKGMNPIILPPAMGK